MCHLVPILRCIRLSTVVWVCKGQRHVARRTFAAELLSAGDAVDQGLLLAQQLHDMLVGPTSASDARQRRVTGTFLIPLILLVDATSVLAAVTATFVQIPADKSPLCHIQFIESYSTGAPLKPWAGPIPGICPSMA